MTHAELSSTLGIPIERITWSVNGFSLYLDNGRLITLGNATKLLNQNSVRNRIADGASVVIRKFTHPEWTLIVAAVMEGATWVDEDRNRGWLYVVETDPEGPVKIGWTKNLTRRMEAYATHSPFRPRLLACWPGSRDDETLLHHRCAGFRIRGEWYDRRVLALLPEVR